ncbi:MAG: hypothetical protein WDZ80_04755 [Candidatus Paceibacterota bacterium]
MNKSNNLIDLLEKKTRTLTSSSYYKFISSLVILINPLALLPQLVMVFTASSVEGVSLSMYVIFAFIQGAITLEGIRTKSPAMFWSMAISLLESLIIILMLFIRG